ncbi:MAG TPA: peptidoglycan-binding protein [Leptolyngbyaceae cyanobacterium M65_K2018_010]|nr:peptidoglycan-binding protein [Leptolyngbyaceae cyanobacterium M65_K2018_010]
MDSPVHRLLPMADEVARPSNQTQFPGAMGRPWRQISASVTLATGLWLSVLINPVRANSGWGQVVYVNTPPGYALNSRWGPGTQFGVHTKTRRGCPLTLSGARQNGWLQLTNGTWVAGNLVSSVPRERNACISTSTNIATVITPAGYGLNIRTGPGTSFARVGQYVNGTQIAFTGRFSGTWTELTDGRWVDGTFLKFASGQGPTRPSPQPLPQPLPDPNVMDLQRRLRQIGFLPGNFVISGIYDEATQAAVREFQRVNGLPVTGIVDAATWRALYDATEPRPTPPPTTPPPTTPPPTTPPPTTPPPTGGGQQMRVSTDGEGALVFDGPGPEYNLLRTLADGTTVTTTGRVTGNWTELAGGGWVFSLWLTPI